MNTLTHNTVDNITTNSKKHTTKTLFLELIRVLAVICVIYNHTNDKGFMYFTTISSHSPTYWISMALSILCTIAVPAFYMISGTTLLGKDEDIFYILKHRVSKIVIVLVTFSFIQYMNLVFKYNTGVYLPYFFEQLYSKGMIVPYWYLYNYIAFLLSLPFIRKIARTITKKEICYLFVLAVMWNALIPLIQFRLFHGDLSINTNLTVPFINNILIYPLIGYFFSRNPISTRKLKYCWISFAICLVFTCYMTHYKIIITAELAEGLANRFFSAFNIVYVPTIFLTIQKFCTAVQNSIPNSIQKLILSLGSCTFGIYLIEQIIRERLYEPLYDVLKQHCHPYLAIQIYVICVFLIAYCIIFIAKKIKFIRNII